MEGDKYNLKLLWVSNLKPKEATNADGIKEAYAAEAPGDRLPMLYVSRSSILNPTQYCVVLAHGNYCDIGEVSELAFLLSHRLQANVIVPEYPGYGEAPGIPSEDSVDAALRSASVLATHVMQVPADRIVVLGQSVGTGPAAALAAWMSGMDEQTGASTTRTGASFAL